MSNGTNQFRKDVDELLRLMQLTDSKSVKHILQSEAEKLTMLAESEERTQSKASAATAAPRAASTKLTNYAWDQSDKFLKIYITMNGVHKLSAESVTCKFEKKSFELQVLNAEQKCSVLTIKNLLHDVNPAESHFKVKTDMVALFLRKLSTQHWECVTESERKTKDVKTPQMKNDEDPNAGLMNLMKQMYDDGDDDMKRTIAKAWTEARDKKDTNLDF